MTCDDYLAMLETLPVEELTHGDAREHAAVCRDCNRVTRVVAERERNMIMAYGDVMPSAVPAAVATSAIAMARRRRVAAFYKAGLALAAVATLGMIAAMRVAPSRAFARRGFVRERFELHCASPGGAARMLRANLPDVSRSIIRVYEPDGVVEIEAPASTMPAVRSVLDQYNERCIVGGVPALPPLAPLPPARRR